MDGSAVAVAVPAGLVAPAVAAVLTGGGNCGGNCAFSVYHHQYLNRLNR